MTEKHWNPKECMLLASAIGAHGENWHLVSRVLRNHPLLVDRLPDENYFSLPKCEKQWRKMQKHGNAQEVFERYRQIRMIELRKSIKSHDKGLYKWEAEITHNQEELRKHLLARDREAIDAQTAAVKAKKDAEEAAVREQERQRQAREKAERERLEGERLAKEKERADRESNIAKMEMLRQQAHSHQLQLQAQQQAHQKQLAQQRPLFAPPSPQMGVYPPPPSTQLSAIPTQYAASPPIQPPFEAVQPPQPPPPPRPRGRPSLVKQEEDLRLLTPKRKRSEEEAPEVPSPAADVPRPVPHPQLKEWLNAVLDQLVSSDFSVYFREPVNPVDLPDYHSRVKDPMDLHTIRNLLNQGEICSIQEFIDKMKQIKQNSYFYNGEKSEPSKDVNRLFSLADKEAGKFLTEEASHWARTEVKQGRRQGGAPATKRRRVQSSRLKDAASSDEGD